MSDPIRKPDEFPSRSESILSDTIGLEGYSIETPPRSRIETLLIELKEIIDQGGGSSTAYATSLEITMDEYFVMSATLKNKDGDTLGQVQTVDLPLESVVVNGSYDSINKNVVLTLENGNTVSFSVADLVSGLQTEITSNNKLDADLVDDSTATHKFATAAQLAQIQINKTVLDNKANKATTYTKTEVDTALSAKANAADVYSKTAVDTALGNKADKSTTYTKTEVDTALVSKQNTIDVNSKLSADLVDDTNATHKFATAAQLSQITTNENNILKVQDTLSQTYNSADCNVSVFLCQDNGVTDLSTYYNTSESKLHFRMCWAKNQSRYWDTENEVWTYKYRYEYFGLIATNNTEKKTWLEINIPETTNETYVKKSTISDSQLDDTGGYTWNKSNVNVGDIWYIRPYIIMTDLQFGNQFIKYGAVYKVTAGVPCTIECNTLSCTELTQIVGDINSVLEEVL